MRLPKGLIYTSDDIPGITRTRRGKGYSYATPDGKLITAPGEKQRLGALAIPPAYRDVWYCPLPNGHLQATGLDDKGRKQYRYHELWTIWRDNQKFQELLEFGLALPKLRSAMAYAMKPEESLASVFWELL